MKAAPKSEHGVRRGPQSLACRLRLRVWWQIMSRKQAQEWENQHSTLTRDASRASSIETPKLRRLEDQAEVLGDEAALLTALLAALESQHTSTDAHTGGSDWAQDEADHSASK